MFFKYGLYSEVKGGFVYLERKNKVNSIRQITIQHFFVGGWSLSHFFCITLLVCVKLGYILVAIKWLIYM